MGSEEPARTPASADRGLLLDRDRELASVDAVLEGLEAGRAGTLLIERPGRKLGIASRRELAGAMTPAEA